MPRPARPRSVPASRSGLAPALFLAAALVLPGALRAERIDVLPNGDAAGPTGPSGLRAALARAAAISPSPSPDPGSSAPGAPSRPPVTIRLAPGHHWLDPEGFVEPTCGNCEDPATPVPATRGAVLRGDRVRIVGPDGRDGEPAVVHTRSGYGLLVQDCRECEIANLVLTDGTRDTSGTATDAAIVVQRSSVRIHGNTIRDNIGDPAVIDRNVVGIIGIAGREGARMRIEGNRILRNSWDGIALYRDAEAEIVDNGIDGIDLALGRTAGGGRGVGIGLTWNARAEVRGNRVARYWKGIGVFVDAQAVVEENVVEQIATWGLSLWDAGKGRPSARFRHNVVDSTGACGVALVRESEAPAPGELVGNVLTRTCQNPRYDSGEPYCHQAPIALHAVPEGFPIEDNLLFSNRRPGDPAPGGAGAPGGDPAGGDRLAEDAVPNPAPGEAEIGLRLASLAARLAVYDAAARSDFFRRHGLGSGRGWSWGR